MGMFRRLCLFGALCSCGAAGEGWSSRASTAEGADSSAAVRAAPSSESSAEVVHSIALLDEPPIALSLSSSPPAKVEPPPAPNPDELRIEDVCSDSRRRLAEALGRYPRGLEDSTPATVADLELEPPQTDSAFLDDVGPGYWGPTDIDGDGADDRMLRFTTVDFWSHVILLKKGDCWRYAGLLEGYQVEITRGKGGSPRARVHTYPVGPNSRVDAYRWSGSAFVR